MVGSNVDLMGFAMDRFENGYVLVIVLMLGVLLLRAAVRYFYLKAGRARPAYAESAPRGRSTGVSRALLAMAGCGGIAFVILTILVLNWNEIFVIDGMLNSALKPFRTPWLLAVFVQITSVGTIFCMTTIAVVTSALIWALGRKAFLAPLWISFVGAESTTWITKYVISRARPDFLTGITEHNPSFPSGHATASTVILGFLGFIIVSEVALPTQKIEAAFWVGTAIAAICFSRLFLSLHYLSDVVSGFLVGSAWLLIGVAMARLAHSRGAGRAS